MWVFNENVMPCNYQLLYCRLTSSKQSECVKETELLRIINNRVTSLWQKPIVVNILHHHWVMRYCRPFWQERREMPKYPQLPRLVYVQRFETMKQLGLWSSLGIHVCAEDGAPETVRIIKKSWYSWLLYIYSSGCIFTPVITAQNKMDLLRKLFCTSGQIWWS